jgi:hypothetical protein
VLLLLPHLMHNKIDKASPCYSIHTRNAAPPMWLLERLSSSGSGLCGDVRVRCLSSRIIISERSNMGVCAPLPQATHKPQTSDKQPANHGLSLDAFSHSDTLTHSHKRAFPHPHPYT